MQGISPLNVDAVAKLVIQPIPCNWNGCAAVVNSWDTLQKHLLRHCQEQDATISSKGKVFMACQIARCSSPEHSSLATLEKHVNGSHLFPLSLPCPALGCLYATTAASRSLAIHFSERHQKLLHANPQGRLFKPLASLLPPQLELLPLLPLESKFLSYKLLSRATRRSFPLDKGLRCLTESISGLTVTQSLKERCKEHKVTIASTFAQHLSSFDLEDDLPGRSFPDLSLKKFSHHYINFPSCSKVESTLSAPPPWKLDAVTAAFEGAPVSIGYDVFVVRNS